MRHVQQRTRCVPLNTHVFGSSETCKGYESAGLCDLGLVVVFDKKYLIRFQTAESRTLTMRSEVGDTPDGVALNFNIRAQHLTNQRLETPQFDDEKLVVR